MVMDRTPFKLNFGRHPWKDNLVAQTEFPRIEEFLTGLQRSWGRSHKVNERSSKEHEEVV